MDVKIQIKLLLISLIVITAIIPAFSVIAHSPVGSQHNENHYEVDLTNADVTINRTFTMVRGEIIELNVSITNDNVTLTIIVDILNDSGRLWGLYVEPAIAYYQAKAADSYKNFDKKMDHVTIYQVVQLTLKPGEYVIALHDSHAHQEPDTNFDLLVVSGHVGVETIILPNTATSQPSAPSFDLLTSLSLLSIGSVLKVMKKKK